MTDDRQALSTARYSRAGQLATADTCLNAAADFELRNIVGFGDYSVNSPVLSEEVAIYTYSSDDLQMNTTMTESKTFCQLNITDGVVYSDGRREGISSKPTQTWIRAGKDKRIPT